MQAVLTQNLNQINVTVEENTPISVAINAALNGAQQGVQALIGNFYQTYAPVLPGGSSNTYQVQAAQTLAAYRPVTVTGFQCDSNNPAHKSKLAGIATDAANTGFNCDVQAEGLITNPAWAWNIGDAIFIRGTQLSNIAPTIAESKWSQKIGTATKPDTILLELAEPILL